MSTKSFTEAKKPGRQPTPEEIAAFEETGRAIAMEKKITAKAQTRESGNANTGEQSNTEISISGKTDTRDSGKAPLREDGLAVSRKDGNAGALECAKAESSNFADTEIRSAEPTVRLTVDLPESVHTRFKAACVVTRRKMVEEIRVFIERRTAELESETRR